MGGFCLEKFPRIAVGTELESGSKEERKRRPWPENGPNRHRGLMRHGNPDFLKFQQQCYKSIKFCKRNGFGFGKAKFLSAINESLGTYIKNRLVRSQSNNA
jgi:hypothetical protein